jgi:cell filamentation protein
MDLHKFTMNIANPFREGNGRSARIWLDLMLKKEIKQVIDWNVIDKSDYLAAMERSVVKDIEIKYLLKGALTDKINDREIFSERFNRNFLFLCRNTIFYFYNSIGGAFWPYNHLSWNAD